MVARSVAVLRESGLSGGAADGIRQAKLVRQFGGFAAVIESAATRDPNAIAITDEWGDVTFAELQRHGATVIHAPEDMPWGERVGFVRDPDGNPVAIATAPQPA